MKVEEMLLNNTKYLVINVIITAETTMQQYFSKTLMRCLF